MKKFISLFLCLAFLSTSSSLLADAETAQTTEITSAPSEQTEITPAPAEQPKVKASPKEVGRASNEGIKAAKKRDWQNWLFASTSVAIAIVALLLLRDSGHAPQHHD